MQVTMKYFVFLTVFFWNIYVKNLFLHQKFSSLSILIARIGFN